MIQCVEVCAVRQTKTQTRTQTISDYALILYSAVHLLSKCTIVRVTKQGVTVISTQFCDLCDQSVACVCVCKARSVKFSTSQASINCPLHLYGFLDIYNNVFFFKENINNSPTSLCREAAGNGSLSSSTLSFLSVLICVLSFSVLST